MRPRVARTRFRVDSVAAGRGTRRARRARTTNGPARGARGGPEAEPPSASGPPVPRHGHVYARRVLTEAAEDDAWADVLDAVRAACRDEDGQDPLDEAARLRLKHHGLSGSDALAGRRLGFRVGPRRRRRPGRGPGRRADVGWGASWRPPPSPATAPVTRVVARRPPGGRRTRRAARPASGPRAVGDAPVGGRRRCPSWSYRTAVTVRGYRAPDADEVLRVNAAAFAHHPEQGSMDADDLAARMAEPWFDPAGLLVADTGDRTAAASTGPSSTTPTSARCTSSPSTRPPRAGAWAGC